MSESEFRIERVGVVGAGLMGSGIAEVSAVAGFPTVLVRHGGGDASEARDRVARALDKRVARGKLTAELAGAALGRLTVTGERDALAGCDLVVESIAEDAGAKRSLFADLATRAPSAAMATNTSTLRLADLCGEGMTGRFLGLHFFSPVSAMSLVELSVLPTTRPAVAAAAKGFVAALGKTPVEVVDSAGFVVNRLLVPYLVGAIAAYGSGLADATAIDTAMRLGCGHPMGPLALADLIGLDVVYAMSKLLFKEFDDGRFAPPPLLRRLVQDGQLGKKTGLGLYDYSVEPARANPAIVALIHGDLGEERDGRAA
jgi:3-hydroxybutyryl-CoA dehydrogenase